jgi:pyruvate/2-oxoglutarate dehydrogenase complex dihydrolipoamide dehydrogenase (E3) component
VKLPARLKTAIVIGSEHVAFSALWTARHAGLRVRAMIEAEDRIMSIAPLGILARALGVEILLRAQVRELAAERGQLNAVLVETAAGSRRLPADAVIFSGNWAPEVAALQDGPVTLDPRTGGPEIDQAARTSSPGIFAAGNLLRGVESSGWCANEGRHAGLMAARYLRGEMSGAQARGRVELAPGIAFVVPQLWGTGAGAAPVSLRVGADARGRRLAVTVGGDQVWSSPRRDFLRRRRIAVPATIDAPAPVKLSID